jgi:hypothetical protein
VLQTNCCNDAASSHRVDRFSVVSMYQQQPSPSVFGRNLQCEPVRRVNILECKFRSKKRAPHILSFAPVLELSSIADAGRVPEKIRRKVVAPVNPSYTTLKANAQSGSADEVGNDTTVPGFLASFSVWTTRFTTKQKVREGTIREECYCITCI